MSIQEKRPIVSIISNLLTFGIYYAIVFNIYKESVSTIAEELKFWGAIVLIFIPVLIVAKIVLYIIFSIFNTIITGEKEENFLKDEFGRLIESKATRNSYHVFMGGFLLSMGSLVIGMPLLVMFNIILLSLIAAGMVQDLSEFYYLRKGI